MVARRRGSSEGFTLIELLIAILLLGVILPTITTAFVLGYRTSNDTTSRITDSAELQIAAAYFATDVESSDNVSTTDTACSGTTPIVRFSWVDQGTTYVVAYYTDTATGSTRLLRASCTNGGAASVRVLVRALSATAPSVTCPPAASCTTQPVAVQLRATTNDGLAFTLQGTRRDS